MTKPKKKAAPSKKTRSEAQQKSPTTQATTAQEEVPIVGIGASAGGLEAFAAFFESMPADAGIGFVLVAHLDPDHVSLLPELLQKHTKMPVLQAQDDVKVEADHVYVIPPNKELTIFNGSLQLLDLVRSRGANLPIDAFFRALAQDQGRNAVCIVLSGTGSDGTLGLKAVKEATGMVMVQDEASAAHEGMPRSARATGLADYVLPPAEMPEQLIKYIRHAREKPAPVLAAHEGEVPSALQKIYVLLRTRTDHDFSLYKKNTICRRIERRMNLHQIDSIADYVRYLRESDREVDILFKELLIGVTNFFRDPQAFETLKTRILPGMLAGKPLDHPFRVWVTGCATGEEAYSVALTLHEAMEEAGRHFHVQIFGTDIDEEAIDRARMGLYPGSILADVGPERMRRYFSKEEDGRYRVKRLIREMLVFAPQNVIKDPPFTKLDLLCCRNLLIYLGPELQQRLLPMFHYSLKPDGILFLGSSETIGTATDLFSLVDRKWKLFRRKTSAGQARPVLNLPPAREETGGREMETHDAVQRAEGLSVLQLVETILRQSDAPPCAIINDASNVIYIHGRTGRFLEPAEGKASANILEMARPGLKKPLAEAIRQVATHKQEVTRRDIKVNVNGGRLRLTLTVKPILERVSMRGLMMVVFEETADPGKEEKNPPGPATSLSTRKTAEDLEQELQYTRENLQTTIEELETSNEELKSTNEELQSTNEELQSTNEELETSKEELQSLNEESATVNAELRARIDELTRANDDIKNLLDCTDIATIFLDTELRIFRYTPTVTEIIPVTGTDLGRPVRHLATQLVGVDLDACGHQVLKDLGKREAEVASADGRTYIMRVRPYRTVANVIDGVVITFQDISVRKKAEDSVQRARQLAEAVVDTVREPLVVLDANLQVVRANRAFYRAFRTKQEQTEGKRLQELADGQWDIPGLSNLLQDILARDTTVEDYEIACDVPAVGKRNIVVNARQLHTVSGESVQVLLAMEITGRP